MSRNVSADKWSDKPEYIFRPNVHYYRVYQWLPPAVRTTQVSQAKKSRNMKFVEFFWLGVLFLICNAKKGKPVFQLGY